MRIGVVCRRLGVGILRLISRFRTAAAERGVGGRVDSLGVDQKTFPVRNGRADRVLPPLASLPPRVRTSREYRARFGDVKLS